MLNAQSQNVVSSLVALAVATLASFADIAVARAEEVMSKEILAVQIRKQGFSCDQSLSAERDNERSKPNDTMWILKCSNGGFRVRIVPKMAAEVEQMK